MSHKDAPPETPSQIACREFWQAAQPHVIRAWGRAADGNYLSEQSRLLHKAWEAAQQQTEPGADMVRLPRTPTPAMREELRMFSDMKDRAVDTRYAALVEAWERDPQLPACPQAIGGAE
ncbi:MAG TPA: hypothetical protein VFE72_04960 [Lysobacter sp.]|nr:hypothetical protein [Lysobacter sp.]